MHGHVNSTACECHLVAGGGPFRSSCKDAGRQYAAYQQRNAASLAAHYFDGRAAGSCVQQPLYSKDAVTCRRSTHYITAFGPTLTVALAADVDAIVLSRSQPPRPWLPI